MYSGDSKSCLTVHLCLICCKTSWVASSTAWTRKGMLPFQWLVHSDCRLEGDNRLFWVSGRELNLRGEHQKIIFGSASWNSVPSELGLLIRISRFREFITALFCSMIFNEVNLRTLSVYVELKIADFYDYPFSNLLVCCLTTPLCTRWSLDFR